MGIFRAFGAQPPRYGHLPLIVGPDRARLSKRHGATAVGAYRQMGFLPDAVVNYLARLGWSHGDQEIFTRDELVAHFDIEGVGRAAAAFDLEKFAWVNAQHMKAVAPAELAGLVAPLLAERGVTEVDINVLESAVALLRERARTLVELADQAMMLVGADVTLDPKAAEKFLCGEQLEHLRELAAALEDVEPWTAEAIEAGFREVVERLDLKLGKLAQPARVALTGGTASPGIFEVCAVLGKPRTVARLRAACDREQT
jgi:glutamyl-tRNA synthetase